MLKSVIKKFVLKDFVNMYVNEYFRVNFWENKLMFEGVNDDK